MFIAMRAVTVKGDQVRIVTSAVRVHVAFTFLIHRVCVPLKHDFVGLVKLDSSKRWLPWPDAFEIFLTCHALDCHNKSRDRQLKFNLILGSSVSRITDLDCDDDVNNIDMNRVGFQHVHRSDAV